MVLPVENKMKVQDVSTLSANTSNACQGHGRCKQRALEMQGNSSTSEGSAAFSWLSSKNDRPK